MHDHGDQSPSVVFDHYCEWGPTPAACLLCDLLNVCVYINDILVSGKDEADHLHNLEQVLTHLTSASITLKRSKCVFATTSVEYLGHIIDSNGLLPSPTKVQAIQEALAPTNLTD